MPKDIADRKPPDFQPGHVIPLKILVDEEQKYTRERWEKDLRHTVTAASDVIERHCGLRFEVQLVDTWTSENKAAGLGPLLADFELKVDPRPAWLAIGFTSQQKNQRGKAERHAVRWFPRHILVRDWTPKANQADRVELVVHLLGHYLGAMDSPEPLSVMRPLTGADRLRKQPFPMQFDALNTLLLNVVADQIRTTGPAEWPDLPPHPGAVLPRSGPLATGRKWSLLPPALPSWRQNGRDRRQNIIRRRSLTERGSPAPASMTGAASRTNRCSTMFCSWMARNRCAGCATTLRI